MFGIKKINKFVNNNITFNLVKNISVGDKVPSANVTLLEYKNGEYERN